MSYDKLPKNLKKVAILKFLAEYSIDGQDKAMEWFQKSVGMELLLAVFFQSKRRHPKITQMRLWIQKK